MRLEEMGTQGREGKEEKEKHDAGPFDQKLVMALLVLGFLQPPFVGHRPLRGS